MEGNSQSCLVYYWLVYIYDNWYRVNIGHGKSEMDLDKSMYKY